MLNGLDENGNLIYASPSKKALCPFCKKKVIAKCGEINIWHWAHENKQECDSWSEGETDWHLEWKKQFEPYETEVTLIKGDNETKHRADIYYAPFNDERKVVVEIQKNHISTNEIQERECFYGNMCWVFNAEEFKQNLSINKYDNGNYPKSRYFSWKYKRKSLLVCKLPIYLDLGEDELFRIVEFKGRGGYGYYIKKEKFKEELKKVYYSCDGFWKEEMRTEHWEMMEEVNDDFSKFGNSPFTNIHALERTQKICSEYYENYKKSKELKYYEKYLGCKENIIDLKIMAFYEKYKFYNIA